MVFLFTFLYLLFFSNVNANNIVHSQFDMRYVEKGISVTTKEHVFIYWLHILTGFVLNVNLLDWHFYNSFSFYLKINKINRKRNLTGFFSVFCSTRTYQMICKQHIASYVL